MPPPPPASYGSGGNFITSKLKFASDASDLKIVLFLNTPLFAKIKFFISFTLTDKVFMGKYLIRNTWLMIKTARS